MKLLNKNMLKNAAQLAKAVKAHALFLYLDCLEEEFNLDLPKDCKFVAVTQGSKNGKNDFLERYPHHILLPPIKLGRIALIQLSIAFAIPIELIAEGDKVVFACGSPELRTLDTLTVLEMGRESEIVTTKNIAGIAESVSPQVFEMTLKLAIELANKGREGKPLGTIFVLGDEERVMQLSKQMIINPFKGYSEEERNILSPHLKETLREFSALDGAFVIGAIGTVITAGRYLGATADGTDVARGLGSRHLAAAGITALTKAVAIVISESTGDVRIFKDGKTVMVVEKGLP
jgi:DNA integrity scanning protein DisA with diadenylate cyclase activity